MARPVKSSEQILREIQERRQQRVFVPADRSMGFVTDLFKREIARPYKQLGDLVTLWNELLPVEIARGTRLESLSRGVLSVAVDSSARLYELDRRLREGLERDLITRHKGPAFRKVKLRVQADGWAEQR